MSAGHFMARFRIRWAAAVTPLLLLSSAVSVGAQGYFGRNKVQYTTFDWHILKSEHFDNFFYPSESTMVHDAARMAERWYARHSDTFRHAFDRKELVFYADHPDFEQTNVIQETLEEGTGGVTESNRTRVIMPFTGYYPDEDHVLGHELVHVFQYNIAEGTPGGGLMRLDALPLWLIEGMAEYFSLGREDPLTALWMRDAVMRNKFPTIKQLTTDPRFFPYRYGQALWAYVGGRWGDRAIVDVYRAALRLGWDQALVRVLGENQDSLSKDWAAANKAMYLPQLAGRTHPDSTGDKLVSLARSGDYNLSPTISPDGKLFAFFSTRSSLFSIDLLMGDAKTGRIIKKLGGPSSDPHFDAISWTQSAGDWSPDSKHFAFIVYAGGANEIAILNTGSASVERRIKLPGIGSVMHISWSPDGKTLAFTGQVGGMSDLYLLDLTTGTIRQLTNDKYADYQPTWSPDGKMIAFSSDRSARTDFDKLQFSPLQLATYELATGKISVYSPFAHGKHLNPQFSPDGKDLFFISDQDGIPDVYRLELATSQVYRITHVSTGVNGLTTYSPALSVSRQTGRMLINTFYDQGNEIRGLDASQTIGTPVTPAAVAEGEQLPPPTVTRSLVLGYLADPTTGLPSGSDFQVIPYHSSFSLDAIGQPSIGVAAGGPFGAGVAGGVSMIFGDQLSDRQIFAAIQANGTVKDIGGALQYYNLRKRWNWGAGIEHIPYLTGGVYLDTAATGGPGGYSVNQLLQRIYIDQAQLFAQYPFTTTKRFEFSTNLTHYGFDTQLFRTIFTADNTIVDEQETNPATVYKPVWFAEPSVALVGDNSFSAFTSPVDGGRYRMQYTLTTGSVTYQTALADYRKYFFMRPLSLAIRGMHVGRYGSGAEDVNTTWPIYLGDETLVRGYGLASFSSDECQITGTNSSATGCPVFDRLFGSKVDVANAELRIPLFGTEGFGLINFPFLPTEMAPFVDAGVSYTNAEGPDFRFTRSANSIPDNCPVAANSQQAQAQSFYPCADRIPVFSTGVSFRFNLMGYAILEAYAAHPFQRPKKNWVWGFQLAPGW
jgi:Tol biopolymer transport system component